MVEAVCNPLVASVYPEEKTTKLNQFHLWFPGGIVIGSLVAFAFGKIGLNWQVDDGGHAHSNHLVRHSNGAIRISCNRTRSKSVSDREMYSALLNPLFLIITLPCLVQPLLSSSLINGLMYCCEA